MDVIPVPYQVRGKLIGNLSEILDTGFLFSQE